MWPWIKRWRDWAMHDLWPLYRIGLQPQAMHFRYEKAGRIVDDQPIPWNAEAVLVEATVRLPKQQSRRKTDFQLRVPGQDLVPAEHMQGEADEHHRVRFRVTATRRNRRRRVALPRQGAGSTRVALSEQGRVSAKPAFADADLVRSPRHANRGLPDVRLQPVPRSARQRGADQPDESGAAARPRIASRVPLRAQRRGEPRSRRAVQFATGRPAGVGYGRAAHAIRAASAPGWRPGCSATAPWPVSACAASRSGTFSARCASPTHASWSRPRPARYASRARCRPLRPPSASVRVFWSPAANPAWPASAACRSPLRCPERSIPRYCWSKTCLSPMDPPWSRPERSTPSDLQQVSGFELSIRGQSLGVLSLCPAPTATFTTEGGFKPHHDYTWSAAAEEEMNERLNRLLEGRGKAE